MKTPPLYKAKIKWSEEFIEGYLIQRGIELKILVNDYEEHKEITGSPIEDLSYEIIIEPETLQIQCSDGRFRPVGEVEIVTKAEMFKLKRVQQKYRRSGLQRK